MIKRELHVPVLVLVLLINATHEGSGGRKDLIDEDEDGLLGRKLDALTDNVNELADGEVGWHQVLLFIDGSDIAFLDLLADDLYRDGLSARCLMSTRRRLGLSRHRTSRTNASERRSLEGKSLPECGRNIFDEYVRPRPCASRRGVRP